MKIKALVMAGVMTLMGAVGVIAVSGGAWASIECPTGSLHAGQGKPSLAECNLPNKEEGDPELIDTVITIINVIVGFVGVIAVIAIVIGGVYYVISVGDSSKTTKGKNAILYGIVGLVISLLAFAIVNFVLTAVF